MKKTISNPDQLKELIPFILEAIEKKGVSLKVIINKATYNKDSEFFPARRMLYKEHFGFFVIEVHRPKENSSIGFQYVQTMLQFSFGPDGYDIGYEKNLCIMQGDTVEVTDVGDINITKK